MKTFLFASLLTFSLAASAQQAPAVSTTTRTTVTSTSASTISATAWKLAMDSVKAEVLQKAFDSITVVNRLTAQALAGQDVRFDGGFDTLCKRLDDSVYQLRLLTCAPGSVFPQAVYDSINGVRQATDNLAKGQEALTAGLQVAVADVAAADKSLLDSVRKVAAQLAAYSATVNKQLADLQAKSTQTAPTNSAVETLRTDMNYSLAQLQKSFSDSLSKKATPVYGETPTGTVNGTNKIFQLAAAPMGGMEVVYVDGLRKRRTGDYTITTTGKITFIVAPKVGVLADYVK